MQHCYSCGMPITENGHGEYCQYCADEKGNLFPKEQVTQGVKAWLQSWGPPTDDAQLQKRAESYLAAMPAWQ